MIVCNRLAFEARCKQRGKTLESAMPCVVGKNGDTWTIDTQHPAYPKAGLGDRVAAALDTFGITKDRVAAAIGVKDCGCQQRQQWLNEFGTRIGIGTPKFHQTGSTDPHTDG